MPRATPTMQRAVTGVLAYLQPTLTSAMHGGHVANSAHYAGRAVDVGAFGGVSVGPNKTTWDAIIAAIGSRRFSKIGTIPEIARSPQAQAWARENGVDLFEDVGSGPHAHFEVAS